MSDEKKVYLLVQQGGSSTELYLQGWDDLEGAEQSRIDCARDGAYATSEVLEIPASLAEHPSFYEVADQLLQMAINVEVVEVPDDEDIEHCDRCNEPLEEGRIGLCDDCCDREKEEGK